MSSHNEDHKQIKNIRFKSDQDYLVHLQDCSRAHLYLLSGPDLLKWQAIQIGLDHEQKFVKQNDIH